MKHIKKINLFIILIFCFVLTSCRSLAKFTHMIYSMNTIMVIELYADDENTALKYFNDIESIYNIYDKESNAYKEINGICNVATLNKNRKGVVSNELYELLKYAFDLKIETNGYYEPFIGNIARLWKDNVLTSSTPVIPTNDDIEKELENIKTSSIIFKENNNIELIGNANLDLGGIAKGYATHKVYQYLQQQKVANYLVNAGNSNVLVSTKPNGDSYKIGVKNLNNTGYYHIIETKDKAIVTSSYKEQNKTIDGVLYTHLINPKTGYTTSNYASLTIIGDDSGLLDAYSTALYAMSLDEIKSFLSNKDIDIVIYGVDNLIYSSMEGKQ